MESRGHFDALELDELLLGRQRDVLDACHLRTCSRCREALLDLALMAGIARGADFSDPLSGEDTSDPPLALALAASIPPLLMDQAFDEPDEAGVKLFFQRSYEPPAHLSRPQIDGVLASAFGDATDNSRFLDHVLHLASCDRCLGRFLYLSRKNSPSPRLVAQILTSLNVRSDPGPTAG